MTPSTELREPRPGRSADALRKALRELGEALGPRELEMLVSFGEFLKVRRASRRKVAGPRPSSAGDSSRKPGTTLTSDPDRDWEPPSAGDDAEPASSPDVPARRGPAADG